ncbi:MAG: hypothetical protein LBL13_13250 [Bacteroidales bacterium]|nr:hypothetical protein [Bacteroidales bacterium]
MASIATLAVKIYAWDGKCYLKEKKTVAFAAVIHKTNKNNNYKNYG